MQSKHLHRWNHDHLGHPDGVLVENETVRHRLPVHNVERFLEGCPQHKRSIVHLRAVDRYVGLDHTTDEEEHFANPVLVDPETEKRL